MKYYSALAVLCVMMLLQSAYGKRDRDEDYLDPTDMLNFDPVNMKMKKAPKKSSDQDSLSEERPVDAASPTSTTTTAPQEELSASISPDKGSGSWKPCPDQICENRRTDKICAKARESYKTAQTLLQQYVNTLVYTLESKVGEVSHPVELNLRLRLSYHDISKLREFGEEKDFAGKEDINIHDVHEILRRIIQHASDVVEPQTYVHWLEDRMGLSTPVLSQILAITVSSFVLVKSLPRVKITWSFLRVVLFVTYVISVVFTCMEMYQKEVAAQEEILMKKMSDSCPKPEDLSLWNRLSSYVSSTFTFQEDKCREYYKAVFVNPLVKVTIWEAGAIALVKTFVAPLGIIGTGIKEFVIGLFKDLPIQFQMYILLALAFLVVVTPFLIFGYHVNVFHLLQIGPSPNARVMQNITAPPPIQPQALPQPHGQQVAGLEYQHYPPEIRPPAPTFHARQGVLPLEGSHAMHAAHSDTELRRRDASAMASRRRSDHQESHVALQTERLHTTSALNDRSSKNVSDSLAAGDSIERMKSRSGVQSSVIARSVSDPLAGGDGLAAVGGEVQFPSDFREKTSECEEVCDKLRDVKISSPNRLSTAEELGRPGKAEDNEKLGTSEVEMLNISDQSSGHEDAEMKEENSHGRDVEEKSKAQSARGNMEHQTDLEWTVVTTQDVQ